MQVSVGSEYDLQGILLVWVNPPQIAFASNFFIMMVLIFDPFGLVVSVESRCVMYYIVALNYTLSTVILNFFIGTNP
jgi:hypothetical protein